MLRGVFTEDRTTGVLREHEASVKTAELCRKHGSRYRFVHCKMKVTQ